jgi:ribosomal protein S18 acetylase RimI-like enzyme
MFLQFVAKVPAPGSTSQAWGYITNAYVESEQRSQGVGQKLLQRLIEAGRERQLEFLIVWPSQAAVPFYQRAGFQPVSEVHIGDDDEPPLELML